jgi:hypothetical protein
MPTNITSQLGVAELSACPPWAAKVPGWQVSAVNRALFENWRLDAILICREALGGVVAAASALHDWYMELRRRYPQHFKDTVPAEQPAELPTGMQAISETNLTGKNNPTHPAFTAATQPNMLNDADLAIVSTALLEGRRVEAIRYCRTVIGETFCATDVVHELEREMRRSCPDKFQDCSASSGQNNPVPLLYKQRELHAASLASSREQFLYAGQTSLAMSQAAKDNTSDLAVIAPTCRTVLNDSDVATIKTALLEGRRVDAIRHGRKVLGETLRAAALVHDLEAEMRSNCSENFRADSGPLLQSASISTLDQQNNQSNHSPMVQNWTKLNKGNLSALDAALFNNDRSEAIRIFHQEIAGPLADAVKAVTEREVQLRQTHPERFWDYRPETASCPIQNESNTQAQKLEHVQTAGLNPDWPIAFDEHGDTISLTENKAPTNLSHTLSPDSPAAEHNSVFEGVPASVVTLTKKGLLEPQYQEDVKKLLAACFVRHRSWGIGQLCAIDFRASKVVIDFEDQKGHSMDLLFASRVLQPIDLSTKQSTDLVFEKLNWRLLPAGQLLIDQIERHFRLLAHSRKRSSQRRLDWRRIEFLLEQQPDHAFVGVEEFDGYVAFIFSRVGKTVLENPLEGNAIYVFEKDWKNLSRLTKSEVLSDGGFRTRIVHTREWQSRLRQVLT